MNAQEAAMLCRFAKAACPQQAIDEATPDAWAVLLEDVRFADAKAALVNVVRSQPFVSPAEIRSEVKRIRSKRVLDFGPLPAPPAGLTDSEEIDWQRRIVRRIADGEAPEMPALPPPDPDHAQRMGDLIRDAFRSIEEA